MARLPAISGAEAVRRFERAGANLPGVMGHLPAGSGRWRRRRIFRRPWPEVAPVASKRVRMVSRVDAAVGGSKNRGP